MIRGFRLGISANVNWARLGGSILVRVSVRRAGKMSLGSKRPWDREDSYERELWGWIRGAIDLPGGNRWLRYEVLISLYGYY